MMEMFKGGKMMKRTVQATFILILCLLVTGGAAGWADTFPITPQRRAPEGGKWSLGYYEGGPYIEYKKTFMATLKGLMKDGWIETAVLPSYPGDDTRKLWEWCATEMKSQYLEFKPDAYYTSNWKNQGRASLVDSLIQRLNTRKDIDLMIAMGTWAGQDLANNRHHVSTIALAISDPLASGIIKSYEDSGLDHLHVRVDPLRYQRQVEIFHDIIGFKKLGIMYEDTVRGRSYACVDKIEAVAVEQGFDIVSCFIEKGVEDKKAAEESVKRCFEALCRQADAIYVPMHMGINSDSLPALVNVANQAGVPTFSQAGSEEVKYGILMSISQAEFKYVGQYHADTIARVLNGAVPRQLNPFFEEPSKIALNIKTAARIGYDPLH